MENKHLVSSCRICNGLPTVPLSGIDEQNGKSLYELLSDFANVPVEINDGKPSHICNECSEKLQSSIAFRTQIQEAEKVLQSIVRNLLESPTTNDIKIETADEDNFVYEYLEEDTAVDSNKIDDDGSSNSSKSLSVPSTHINEAPQHLRHVKGESQQPEYSLEAIDDTVEEVENRFSFQVPSENRIAQRLNFVDFEYFEINGERCCGCSFIAASRDDLMKHSKATHAHNYYPDSSYTCPTCYQKYPTQDQLSKHIDFYSCSDIFLCTICDEPFVQKNHLEKHQANSLEHRLRSEKFVSEKETPTGVAQKNHLNKAAVSFTTRKRSRASVTQKSATTNFCCFVRCWESFENHEKLMAHVHQVHDGKRRENELSCLQDSFDTAKYICSICQRTFENNAKLMQHQFYKQNREEHVCQECGQNFYKLHALRDHELKEHSQQPPEYECDVCGKAFRKSSVLKHHRKIHVPFENVPCTEPGCKLSFRDEALMKRHCRNVHGDVFPWECQFCPKKLRTKEAMDIHVRVHTGEKPFACREGCERRFAHATDRARHERSKHTGEKPHKCDQCTAAYVRRRELVIHLKKQHGSDRG
ncbi:zinc finger protein 845-like [Topomyia yanbarensis]|uniref:zinc finger protein 845-like n=1 Tax=Topomyia yanbarensis TaxID=2498891 RepID=UPI00273BA4CC|nr:zinc finger protein 845-like [Topomyia yanbarensis]